MHLDRRLLGWGVFFVLLGLVPLAVRGGLLSSDLVGRWPLLWPFLLIGWGLGFVLRARPGAWLGGALVAITLGLMGGGAIATGFGGIPSVTSCGGDGAARTFEERRGTFNSSPRMSVSFDCGILNVATTDGAEWIVSGGDPDGRGPTVVNPNGPVELRSPDRRGTIFDGARGQTTWNLSLPRTPNLDLGFTINAGHGTVDLSGAMLTTVNLTVNAGALDVDLQRAEVVPHSLNATVNAGTVTIAMPAFDGTASLSLNAGKLTACVPRDAALRVSWSGALASNDLDSSGLVKVDADTWTTAAFDAGQPHLELDVSANAGRFGLVIGGTCDA
jgi:hypothetical protein